MALEVTAVEELRSYLNGVMNRADHHADNVNQIALALTGAILWRMNDAKPIQVMVKEGETTNVLWFHIGDKRYAFSYKHELRHIELRENSLKGPTLHTFTNATSLAEVRSIFQGL